MLKSNPKFFKSFYHGTYNVFGGMNLRFSLKLPYKKGENQLGNLALQRL
jgi:hypothetical protein